VYFGALSIFLIYKSVKEISFGNLIAVSGLLFSLKCRTLWQGHNERISCAYMYLCFFVVFVFIGKVKTQTDALHRVVQLSFIKSAASLWFSIWVKWSQILYLGICVICRTHAIFAHLMRFVERSHRCSLVQVFGFCLLSGFQKIIFHNAKSICGCSLGCVFISNSHKSTFQWFESCRREVNMPYGFDLQLIKCKDIRFLPPHFISLMNNSSACSYFRHALKVVQRWKYAELNICICRLQEEFFTFLSSSPLLNQEKYYSFPQVTSTWRQFLQEMRHLLGVPLRNIWTF